MARGFVGDRAEAYNKLAKMYVPGQLDHNAFVTQLQIAEASNQEPDAVIQRYLQLRAQLRSSVYDTDLT